MPRNEQQRTSIITVKRILKVLTVVALTAVLTFLCVWYGRPAAKMSPEETNRKDEQWPDKQPSQVIHESANIGVDQNDKIRQWRPPMYQNRASFPPVTVERKFIKKNYNWLPANHKYTDNVSLNDHDSEDETKTHQDVNKQKHRYDYSNTETERWAVSQDDQSIGYNRGTYDLTYNAGDNKQTDSPTGENESNMYPATELGSYGSRFSPPGILQNVNIEQASKDYLPSTKNYPPPFVNYNHAYPNKNYQPPSVGGYPLSPITNNNNYQPTPTSTDRPSPQQKLLVPMPTAEKSEFDWQFYGKLALIKLALIKLKAFGVFNVLLFLLFKLNLFLVAVFFKFLLLSKFIAIFKTVVSPLFAISMLPMLMAAMFSIPNRLLQSLFTMIPPLPTTVPTPVTPLSISVPSVQATSGPILQRPSFQTAVPGTVTMSRPGTITNTVIPGQTGALMPSRPAAIPLLRPPNEKTVTGDDLGFRAYRSNGLRLPHRAGHNESLATKRHLVLDTIASVFDSDKCVKRIACRVALAEKTGMTPLWIDWILHGVSKFIPEGELETYFTTYYDVKNKVFDYLPTHESWKKWCSERYNCNVINETRPKIVIKL